MPMTLPTILSAAARFAFAALLLISGFASAAAEPPPGKMRVTWQIRGLFCPEGEKDFRALVAENLPEVRVVAVAVPNAEATFEFDPAVAFDPRFRNVKPEQLLGLFNAKLSPRKPPSIFSRPSASGRPTMQSGCFRRRGWTGTSMDSPRSGVGSARRPASAMSAFTT